MKKIITLIIALMVLPAVSQEIVVSEYYNVSGNPQREWTELLVIQDNVSIAGYSLRDNAGSDGNPSQWVGGVRFRNIPLWQNLRAGTIIVINHRGSNAIDTDASDGYLEIEGENTTYYDQVCWGCTLPEWESAALNLAQVTEIVQIIDQNDEHVHSLSHMPTPLGDYVDIQGPKANHEITVALRNGATIRVVPGLDLSAYGSGSGTDQTAESTANITKGFPNNSTNHVDQNQLFWRELRQPEWGNPVLSANIKPLTIELSWNAAEDAYPQDGIQGYLIVKIPEDQISGATHPVDGTVYSAGSSLGTGEVLDIITSSTTTTFSDNSFFPCGDSFIYRVYAFRYEGNDPQPKNAHGRSYNEENYAELNVKKDVPAKPGIAESGVFNICEGDSVRLEATTTDNNVTWRWMHNNQAISGSGKNFYYAKKQGIYYAVAMFENGCESNSEQVTINVIEFPVPDIFVDNNRIYSDTVIKVCNGREVKLRTTSAENYQWVNNENYISGANGIEIITNREGTYYTVNTNSGLCSDSSFKVTIEYFEENVSFDTDTIRFELDIDDINKTRQFTINNDGSDELILEKADLPPGFEIVSPVLPQTISPGGSVIFTIRYTPQAPGEVILLIKFATQCGEIEIPVYAFKSSSTLQSSILSISYSMMYECELSTRDTSLTLSNTGKDIITIYQPIINSPYTVLSSNFPIELAESESAIINIQFNPISQGLFDEFMIIPFEIKGEADTIAISLHGRVIMPELQFDELNINLGALGSCDESKESVISVYNNSDADVSITGIINSLSFSILNSTPIDIPSGGNEVLNIRFSPANEGHVNEKISINAMPCNLKYILNLSGDKKGIVFSLEKDTLDFGVNYDCGYWMVPTETMILNVSGDFSENPRIISYVMPEGFTGQITTNEILGANNENIIEFNPSVDGEFEGEIVLILEPCNIEKRIFVKGSKYTPSYSLDYKTVDFGRTRPNQPVYGEFTVSNTGLVDLNITGVSGIAAPFSINNPTLPYLLDTGTDVTFSFTYLPVEINDDTVNIILEFGEPCNFSENVTLLGSASEAQPDTFTVSIPVVKGIPGRDTQIPVIINGRSEMALADANINSIDLSIEYNNTLLVPYEAVTDEAAVSGSPQLSLSDGMMNLSIQIENPNQIRDGILAYINSEVFIGDNHISELIISNVSINADTDNEIITNNGRFEIDSVCMPTLRSIRERPANGIELAGSHPAVDNISLKVYSSATEIHNYRILDIFGRLVDSGKLSLKKGVNQVALNTYNIRNGTYKIEFNRTDSSFGTLIIIEK